MQNGNPDALVKDMDALDQDINARQATCDSASGAEKVYVTTIHSLKFDRLNE